MPTKSDIYFQITGGYSNLNRELSSLEPSQLVYLYEIDLKPIHPVSALNIVPNQPIKDGILRIYNDYNLFNIVNDSDGRVIWEGNYYYPFPINAEGFDLTTLGVRPTPKLYIANSSPDGTYNSFYKYLRMQIQSLGDIAGCKLTRIKTFLKYLHGNNFNGNVNPYTNDPSIFEIELPKDIYYIDRKSVEDSVHLEFNLVSSLDIENLSLPSRTILAKRCPFIYRGEGCLYEYNKRITQIHSGVYGEVVNSPINITLPLEAPPVATENEESFFDTIFANNQSARLRFTGISYFRAGISTNFPGWSFTNYTLGGAGTAAAAATILNDNSTSTVGITSQAATAIASLSLTTGAEITRVVLSSNATIRNNYQLEYSQDGTNWYNVPDISGLNSNWVLSGVAAGTYTFNFPSKGINRFWRLSTLNSFAGTQITELNFSGQYRIADSGLWTTGSQYRAGDFTFFEKDKVKFYYVCNKDHTSSLDINLFNKGHWQADACTKSISSCRERWLKNPALRPVIWPIPRNGWTWDRAVYHYDAYWGAYESDAPGVNPAYQPFTTSFTGFSGQEFIYNHKGYHPNSYGPKYRIGKFFVDPDHGYQSFENPQAARLDQWPRRPDVIDPLASFACGIPKDASGNYLNGFLPFGGFPGTNQKA